MAKFEDIIHNEVSDIRERLEQSLLEFFGGPEEASKYAKYYVLEEYPVKMDFDKKPYNYALHFEYRLRLKTPEEMEMEN